MLRKLYRIPNKFSHFINLFIGKVYDLLQLKNVVSRFPFQIVSNAGKVIHVEHSYPANYQAKDNSLFNEWKEFDTFPLDLYQVNDVRLTHEGIVLKKHTTAFPHPIFRNQFGVLYNFFTRYFYKKQIAKPGITCWFMIIGYVIIIFTGHLFASVVC
ncbi:MAG: hypothetical protein H0W84_07640 [Bacteroidetes bacterium]|nr:hypothetical protein [Bacteroidota bacterium]